MGTPLFTPTSGSSPDEPLDWRERAFLDQGCGKFEDPNEQYDVYVMPAVASTLASATKSRSPSETGGLLLGRAYRDHEGIYTVIAAAVVADSASSSPGDFRLTASEYDTLKRKAEATFPAHALVGLWHSHSRESEFSAVDVDEQRTWPKPYSVGLLTFMSDGAPSRVYRGRDATPLQLAASPTYDPETERPTTLSGPIETPALTPSRGVGSGREPSWVPSNTTQRSPVAATQREPEPMSTSLSSVRPSFQPWSNRSLSDKTREGSFFGVKGRTVVLVAIGLILAFAGLGLALVLRSSNPSNGKIARSKSLESSTTVLPGSSRLPATTLPELSTSLPLLPAVLSDADWTCVQSPRVALTVQCHIIPPDVQGVTGWVWNTGDGGQGMQRNLSHTYKSAGMYPITLTAVTPSGPRLVGTKTVEVT